MVKELKDQNEQLQNQKLKLDSEHQELKKENAKLAEDNAQLEAQLVEAVNSGKKDNQIDALNQEKELTKLMVDDLIKSIDSLVDHENQQ